MALADEKYILLTTFRRDGTPVPTPVWVVSLDEGKLGFWTSSGSGKDCSGGKAFDKVSLFTFPNLTTSTVAIDTNCTTPVPSSYTYNTQDSKNV